MSSAVFASAEDLEAFLRGLESSPSDEEGLTELEHLLQCADILRETAPDDAGLQVAGLLHDIGWSLEPSDEHGRAGADAVRELMGERVAELVRLHVDAKRYLVTRDVAYRSRLSAASIATFARQGADMTEDEVANFEAEPFHRDALRLRHADDLAKVRGKTTSMLEAWLQVMRDVIAQKGLERGNR